MSSDLTIPLSGGSSFQVTPPGEDRVLPEFLLDAQHGLLKFSLALESHLFFLRLPFLFSNIVEQAELRRCFYFTLNRILPHESVGGYASGFAQIICGPDKFKPPILSGHCKVCGSVRGNVKVCGAGAVLPGEEILNDLKDITVLISDSGRRILRGTVKDTLRPRKEHAPQKEKSKKRGMER